MTTPPILQQRRAALCKRGWQALLFLAMLCFSSQAFAIGEVDILHNVPGDTSAGPWHFCEGCCGGREPFKAEASGLLDVDADTTINWNLTVNGDTHPFTSHDGGRYITFDIATDTSGEFEILAIATNSDDAGDSASDTDKVWVVEIKDAAVRRKGTSTFSGSADIAAGGHSSDEHKADVRFTIDPVPSGSFSIDFPVTLSGAAARSGTSDTARLIGVQDGNGEGTLTVSDGDISSGGELTETLVSSNVRQTCTVSYSDGSASADVSFVWDTDGVYDFEFPSYFVVGSGDDVRFYPTLDEIAGNDPDSNGTAGEGKITGHSMDYWTRKVEVRYWEYNYNTDTYTAFGSDTFDNLDGSNIEIHFGVKLHSLIDHSATSEVTSGVYENTQTVYDYYSYDSSTGVEQVIEVWNYSFGVYDHNSYVAL